MVQFDLCMCFKSYRAGTSYKVNVFGVFEGGESLPLIGQEMTTMTEATGDPIPSQGKDGFNVGKLIPH